MRELCLTRRCGLCQFQFSAGDDLIALDGGKKYGPLKYGSRPEAHDGSGNIVYKACAYPCIHSRDRAIGCHVSCLNLLNFAPLQRCLEINSYSIEPHPSQERARHRWLRDEVTSRLQTSLPLPPELRREISQYLLQEYVVASIKPCLDRRKAFSIPTAGLALIIQHHVELQGQKYLSNLTIDKDRSNNALAIPKVVYVSEDHRGIQKIVCSTSTDAPNVAYTPGVWWKALPIRQARSIVEFHGDGAKLRHLVYKDGSHTKSTRNISAFPIPQHPKKPFRLYPFHQALYPAPPRINRFPYNFHGITGLSVCCNPEPIALHAHTADDDLSFYKSSPESSVWVHVPFKPDERIMSLWMRHALGRPNQHFALAFTTNLGRTRLLGAQTTPVLAPYPWSLLDTPLGRPSNLFFDSHPTAILALGFDSEEPTSTGTSRLGLPRPLSPHPSPASSEGFLFSRASLEDVVEVTPCRGAAMTRSEITGLSFRYADGKMACVGQVRLDCLDPPLVVKSSQKLHLRFGKTAKGHPYIYEVLQSTENPKSATGTWFDVSWTGTLEWWYSYRQCQVWHNGRRSLRVRG
ncbi:hypothetical protein CEP54_003876 [Fusarium duplospermum]|uniref:Uncharacterized protein n=1 Tax=Fusarium duplospermum TaxID=1325734 RepID=A0A428QLG7_9HYPO|nr:hypothetical protein CEP54_003876 [Fusarium duplospermum]